MDLCSFMQASKTVSHNSSRGLSIRSMTVRFRELRVHTLRSSHLMDVRSLSLLRMHCKRSHSKAASQSLYARQGPRTAALGDLITRFSSPMRKVGDSCASLLPGENPRPCSQKVGLKRQAGDSAIPSFYQTVTPFS